MALMIDTVSDQLIPVPFGTALLVAISMAIVTTWLKLDLSDMESLPPSIPTTPFPAYSVGKNLKRQEQQQRRSPEDP